jgi:SAM-dependent methyltransferase
MEPFSGVKSASVTRAAAQRLQAEIYDKAGTAIWRHAVYDVLHGGWELACIGGREFLDTVATRSGLRSGTRVLDLGCGSGAACQYLSEKTGCWATGIEINKSQLRMAEERRSSSVGSLLSFYQGDVSHHPAPGKYDAVYQLDTFSLLPDFEAAIDAAHAATCETGMLFMADLVAGPHFDRKTEDLARELDGFLNLRPPAQIAGMLGVGGFSSVRSTDRTEQAIRCNSLMLDWLEDPPEALPAGVTSSLLTDWIRATRWYLERFEHGALGYYWWEAAHRASAP